MFHVSGQLVSSCGTPFKPGRIPQGKNIKFILKKKEKRTIRNVVNRVQLQYNTYIISRVAGSGQVDSGVSDGFEYKVIDLGLVNF